jgi:predicted permease
MLTQLLAVFAQTVLPVFLVAGAGWVLARSLPLDGRTLGRILFYLASPALVFRSLYLMDVGGEAVRHIALIAVAVILSTAAVGWLVGAGLERRERAAITLTSSISNNGNMGLPISLFAFGEPGLSLATIYYVVTAFTNNTVGTVVASAGSAPLRGAMSQVLRVPMLYAALAGGLLNYFSVSLPQGIFRSVDIIADAAIPCMLILLGIQLQNTSFRTRQKGVFRSATVRLLVSPILAAAICLLFGVGGLERDVVILQAAMPTAVVVSVLATEFDAAPRLVATIILVTTLLSMATLSVILSFLL